MTSFEQSGNKVIDDFIRNIQEKGKCEFISYDHFSDIVFIAEGGFSKIFMAIWVDGPTNGHDHTHYCNYTVILKKLNNSKNITSNVLNELMVYYELSSTNLNYNICRCFGITQDPITQDIMFIMPYYSSGDLIHYIANDFYNLSWKNKLKDLCCILNGLRGIHEVNIIHRDLHSGNILFDYGHCSHVVISDLGMSKSATESNNNDENYGIIPYIAPEIFHGQKYTTASDMYSFGMIMWEFMTGRRPFWDETHDIELIIKILCDGLRPPIVTNAPEGYVELMKECWNSDPRKRPTARDLCNKICKMFNNECRNRDNNNPTEIIESSDIGPVTISNPGAIYKSRPLSSIIQSTRCQYINLEDPFYYYQKCNAGKRKFEDDLIEDNNDNGQSINKKGKFENEKYTSDYFTKEIELDIMNYHNIVRSAAANIFI